MWFHNWGYGKRTYFELKDILEKCNLPTDSILNFNSTTLFKDIVCHFYPNITASSELDIIIKDSKVNKMIAQYLFPVHTTDSIMYIDSNCWNNPTDEDVNNKFKEWVGYLISIVRMSMDKYIPLIDTLESNKSRLMHKVSNESESDSRFNDTPQDEGVFDDLTHATNTTHQKITNTSDVTTPIDRIHEIEIKLKDYYTEWAKEFNKLFWEE